MLKHPDDYNVVMVDLPGDVLAAVRVDENGYPTVYINDALSLPARRAALRHELRHFANGDFANHLTIYDAEKQASATSPIGVMPRSFRPLTDAEMVSLMIVGQTLITDATGPIECTDPLQLPEPVFDREPDSWANKGKIVW